MDSLLKELPAVYKIITDQVKPMWEQMVEHAGALDLAPLTILDLASGPGEPACTFAKAFPKALVTATDLTDGMLEQARERVEQNSLSGQVTVTKMDFTDLSPIPNGTVDLVTCSLGLHIPVDGPAKTLSEIERVLKPGGTCIATIWEELTMFDVCKPTMLDVTGVPFEFPIDPLAWAGGRIDPLCAEAGLVPAVGHNALVPIRFNMGLPAGDFAFKAGMIMVLPKLAEMQKIDEAKARYAEHALAQVKGNDDLVFEQLYRVLVLKKPEA